MNYLIYVLIYTQIFFFQCNYSQSFVIELEIKNRINVDTSGVNINLKFKNVEMKSLVIVPRHLVYYDRSEKKIPFYATVIWNLQKNVGGKYAQVKILPIHGGLPLDFPENEKYDTLMPSQAINHPYPLDIIYQFTKGEYRIKAQLDYLSPLGEIKTVSNWKYFNVSDSLPL